MSKATQICKWGGGCYFSFRCWKSSARDPWKAENELHTALRVVWAKKTTGGACKKSYIVSSFVQKFSSPFPKAYCTTNDAFIPKHLTIWCWCSVLNFWRVPWFLMDVSIWLDCRAKQNLCVPYILVFWQARILVFLRLHLFVLFILRFLFILFIFVFFGWAMQLVGSSFPHQRSNPSSQWWEHEVVTVG